MAEKAEEIRPLLAEKREKSDIKPVDERGPTPAPETRRPWYILPAIVASQFAGTSVWFAGNAILPDLVEEWDSLDQASLGFLTSSVQLGFIIGTLVFAVLNIADVFRPSRVFMVCSFAAAICNAFLPACRINESVRGLIIVRVLTGFFLAGIYPVGMKVAADWFQDGLGKAMGWLAGALAFGSAIPFLLRQMPLSWPQLLWETSVITVLGGIVIGVLVPNGPFQATGKAKALDPSLILGLFSGNQAFSSASVAFWGHMWELYAFWTWVPVFWRAYLAEAHVAPSGPLSSSLVTFFVIGIGSVGCIAGGHLSLTYGSAKVAFGSLALSGVLSLLSPILFVAAPLRLMLAALLLKGMAVVTDSPQFSTLVTQTAPPGCEGTALTITNCIGFFFTIMSIQLLSIQISPEYLFLLLLPGPIVGLTSLWHYHLRSRPADTKGDSST